MAEVFSEPRRLWQGKHDGREQEQRKQRARRKQAPPITDDFVYDGHFRSHHDDINMTGR